MERRFAHGDDGNTVDFCKSRLDQVEHKDIRHVVYGGGGVAQVIEQIKYSLYMTHGQCNEYHVNIIGFDELTNVRQFAIEFTIIFNTQTFVAAIIKESFDLQSKRRIVFQFICECPTDFVVACKNSSAIIGCTNQQAPRNAHCDQR